MPDRLAVLVAQFSQGGLHGAFIEPLANSDRRPGCEGTLGALHCCLSLRQCVHRDSGGPSQHVETLACKGHQEVGVQEKAQHLSPHRVIDRFPMTEG